MSAAPSHIKQARTPSAASERHEVRVVGAASLSDARPLVLDTNILLDLWVFADEAARPLREALLRSELRWLATTAMRDELARVLHYPHIAPRLACRELYPPQVLDHFDRHACLVEPPAHAPLRCSDPDDQKFIDLAVARQALLLSKDRAVLSMKKRLAAWSVQAHTTLPAFFPAA